AQRPDESEGQGQHDILHNGSEKGPRLLGREVADRRRHSAVTKGTAAPERTGHWSSVRRLASHSIPPAGGQRPRPTSFVKRGVPVTGQTDPLRAQPTAEWQGPFDQGDGDTPLPELAGRAKPVIPPPTTITRVGIGSSRMSSWVGGATGQCARFKRPRAGPS